MLVVKNLSEWSAAIRARDGACLHCGVTDPLVAHHIVPKSERPDLALDMENGQTLCCNCHTKHHNKHPASNGRVKATNNRKKPSRAQLMEKLQEQEAAILLLKTKVSDLEKAIGAAAGRAAEFEKAYDRLISWDA